MDALHDRERFGRRLRRLREARGFTQDELAAAIGTSQGLVHRWETDQTRPTSTMLAKLSDVLAIPMDDLWRGTRSGQLGLAGLVAAGVAPGTDPRPYEPGGP